MRVWECYTSTEFGGVCLTVTLYQDHQLYHWASWSFGPPPRAHLRWDFTFRPPAVLLWSTYSSSANCSLEVWEIKKEMYAGDLPLWSGPPILCLHPVISSFSRHDSPPGLWRAVRWQPITGLQISEIKDHSAIFSFSVSMHLQGQKMVFQHIKAIILTGTDAIPTSLFLCFTG